MYMYMGPFQTSFFAYYIWGGGEWLRSALSLYGGPSHQFFSPAYILCLLYRAPQISFCAYYMYMGPPHISFFAYYIGGPLRSASSLTIWGPLNLFSTNIPYMEHHFHELTIAQWFINLELSMHCYIKYILNYVKILF